MKNYISKSRIIQIKLVFLLVICTGLFTNCEDFLEPETPSGQILNSEIFNDENTATAAVTTLYGKIRDQAFCSGNLSGMGYTMGLYADELEYFDVPGFPWEAFYTHQVLPSNSVVKSIWDESYNIIYLGNEVLEGLESSNSLNDDLKKQLRGEALFVRALAHFYLVNVYGDIPYIITTDYKINSEVARMQTEEVYNLILRDLLEAKTLLGNDYISSERVRANKWVVSALMSRIYLYLEQWQNAEVESSQLIANNMFTLEPDLNKAFLKESKSAIWQLKPKFEGDNSIEATIFIFSSGPPPLTALNPQFLESIEEGDLRKVNWIGMVTEGSTNWYYPNKYKENENTGTSLEYSIVFRLAEQYLIRSESRAKQNNIIGAQQDLNRIRNRAGLQDTNAANTSDLLEAILKERRVELFAEFGHRWFDLRRMGMATELLAPIKLGWKPTDVLLPLPENELLMNPNLNPQNPGY